MRIHWQLNMSFGWLQSGLGREHSKYGMAEFLDIKFVSMGLGYSGGL